jgi:hypothetical protein
MRRAVVALFCSVAATAGVHGGTDDARTATHLRADSAELRGIVAEARERSDTFRELEDHLERSDVIVYVHSVHFATTRLDGRIGFVRGRGDTPGARMLLVELACPRTTAALLATLAHELRHAIEIADAPWIRSTTALATYYRQIGEEAPPLGEGIAFETIAARDTAARVARELAR